jgi:hypothetical protein
MHRRNCSALTVNLNAHLREEISASRITCVLVLDGAIFLAHQIRVLIGWSHVFNLARR